jgi:hypothetical protein
VRLAIYFLVGAFATSSAIAQAPRSAALWDIPATTLARSAALETGAAAPFWNPAAIGLFESFTAGVQAIQTSETLGLSGVLAGVGQRLTPHLAIGLAFGRVQVADLVRTTDSPISDPGEIPVYEQMGGIIAGARMGPASVGVLIRGHDARFDVFRETGLSADAGARVEPLRGLVLGAATRFLPFKLESNPATRFSAGAEYRTPSRSVWGAPAALVARYGIGGRRGASLEHTAGAGIDLANRFRIDGSMTREGAFGDYGWRMAVAMGIRAGRYDILVARASGLAGVGANYRVGLEVDFHR